MEAALRAPISGPVVWFEEIGSTNDELARRAALGATEGLVVGADHQHAGRGRRGRVWLDEPDRGLTVSVLLRPEVPVQSAATIPLVAALAVADMAASLGCPEVTIAWPNDVFVRGAKVAGILCELAGHGEHVHHVVVGIGVNVGQTPAVPGARWTPGCLADHAPGVSRQAALTALLHSLADRYAEWSAGGARQTVAAFSARDGLRGKELSLDVGSRTVTGVGSGIDAEGRLMAQTDAGLETFASGEVVRIISRDDQ